MTILHMQTVTRRVAETSNIQPCLKFGRLARWGYSAFNMNACKCPKCQSERTVKGSIIGGESFGGVFRPETLISWHITLRDGVEVGESFACQECGLVWSSLDPEALREFLRSHCK